MCAVILWMGIGSAFLTTRTAEATNTIRKQMDRGYGIEASLPASGTATITSKRSSTR
jgi:hypothetical protein